MDYMTSYKLLVNSAYYDLWSYFSRICDSNKRKINIIYTITAKGLNQTVDHKILLSSINIVFFN